MGLKKSALRRVFDTMPPMRASAVRIRTSLFSLPLVGLMAGALALGACDKGASQPQTADPEQPGMQSRAAQAAEPAAEPVAAPAPPEAGALAEGAACTSGAECQSGICEGIGCGDDAPGTCKAKSRPCTYDLVPFCGCDGKTFQSSSVCPGQRYERTGACEDTEDEAAPGPSK